MARKEGKRIGKKALELIEERLDREAERLIEEGSRKSDFSGRKTIKKEDLED